MVVAHCIMCKAIKFWTTQSSLWYFYLNFLILYTCNGCCGRIYWLGRSVSSHSWESEYKMWIWTTSRYSDWHWQAHDSALWLVEGQYQWQVGFEYCQERLWTAFWYNSRKKVLQKFSIRIWTQSICYRSNPRASESWLSYQGARATTHSGGTISRW